MKAYKLLVFDWDGTLMDSQQEIISCFQWAARDLGIGIPSSDDIRNIIGLGMKQSVQTVFPQLQEDREVDAFIDAYRHYYFSDEKPPSELYAGVYDMLVSLLNQDYFLAVNTGKGRRGLDGVLAKTGLDQVFHFTRCVDEAHSKPHPQMLQDTMDYLGVDTSATLMIGDTEYDLQMAKNAGVDGLGVCCGAHEKERLLAMQPVACLDNAYEVEGWLLAEVNSKESLVNDR